MTDKALLRAPDSLASSIEDRIQVYRTLRQHGLMPLNGSFFPSGIQYPPITMYGANNQDSMFAGYGSTDTDSYDLYYHIPFCITQCLYCHYPNQIGASDNDKQVYLEALKKEVLLFHRMVGRNNIKIRSILIGGGTPTSISPKQLQDLLAFTSRQFDLSGCSQITVDLDPPTMLGTKGTERLEILRSYGVDRLTIGMQSLNNNTLKGMGRPHSAEDAIAALEKSQAMGFFNNLDFIYGFPGQQLDSWMHDIEKAISLDADEIQLYRLKIKPYGDFTGRIVDRFRQHPDNFLSAEQTLAMKMAAIILLNDKGYYENLSRVFSRDFGIYSHYTDNQCCKLHETLGFGLSAFSSFKDRFYLNTPVLADYYSLIKTACLPINRGVIRKKAENLRWHFILPLKNREIMNAVFKKQTGFDVSDIFGQKIDLLAKNNLIEYNAKTTRLTTTGRFFADEIVQQFFQQHYLPNAHTDYTDGPLNPYLNNDLITV